MDWIYSLLSKIFNFLPILDLSGYITNLSDNNTFNTLKGYVNYFMPIDTFITILGIWLSVCIVYIACKLLYKWVIPNLLKISFLK